MEIVYSIFIGIIVGLIASKIAGIGLQCRRDNYIISYYLFVLEDELLMYLHIIWTLVHYFV